MLQGLSLCVLAVVCLASSQPTCDVADSDDQLNPCEDNEKVLAQLAKVNARLVTAVSQLQSENAQLITTNTQLQTTVTQLTKNVSQLDRDITDLNNRQHSAKQCPADFTYNASANGCYKLVTTNMEWLVAGLACRSLHKDAYLLVINDAMEQAVIADLLDFTNETDLSGCNRDSVQGVYFWTAGQRVDPSCESTFIWRVTSTSPCGETQSIMSYVNWHDGQPDYYKEHEACVNLCRSHSHAWNDFPCHLETCFICEIDMNTVTA